MTPTTLPSIEQMTDILDIKPILKPHLFWLYLALGLLFILILFFLYRWFRHKRPVTEKTLAAPVYTPRELALKALKELDALGLLEHGQSRKYYFRLSEIVRHFLQGEFLIPAVDATTEEIRRYFHSLEPGRSAVPAPAIVGGETPPLREEEKKDIEEILDTMDLVKFAKFVPSDPQNKDLRQMILGLIDSSNSPSPQPSPARGEGASSFSPSPLTGEGQGEGD